MLAGVDAESSTLVDHIASADLAEHAAGDREERSHPRARQCCHAATEDTRIAVKLTQNYAGDQIRCLHQRNDLGYKDLGEGSAIWNSLEHSQQA